MDELKSCPFCGGKAITNVRYWQCGGEGSLMLIAEVKCSECGTSKGINFQGHKTQFSNYIEAFNLASEEWNRRADNAEKN